MRSLLLEACHQVAQRDDRTLSAKQYKALRRRYRTILTQAKRELPEIPPRADGQRGRIAKSDAHNLRERLKTYETEVLRFAQDPDVSFTNNRAERDLRMSKVKQKVSGCFRTGTCAPTPGAESQATCNPPPPRDTTRSSQSRSPSPVTPRT